MAYCSIPGLCIEELCEPEDNHQMRVRRTITNLDSSVLYCNRAGDFRSSSTVHDTVIPNQVTDNANGIVQ
jgi:hypothetical protein